MPTRAAGFRSRPGAALTRLGRRRSFALAALAVAAAASAGVAYVVGTSAHTPDRGLTAALTVITACAFVVSGLIALHRRPAESEVPAEYTKVHTLVEGAKEELGRAIEELRGLAHGIHPQILSDRGLAAAVETLATRSPLPVRLSVPEERLPEPIEATAYYLVSEALANATKHSRASRLEVCVGRENGMLLIKISDDGVGGASTAGSGLRGLIDRVEALDGRLYVTSPAGGGTTIRAEIPCVS